MTPIDILLPRLARVRQVGPGRWMASCPGPSHIKGDRSPSLSIRESEDGRVLLHCFAGCAVEIIASAIGLDLADLFPPRLDSPALTGIRPATPRHRAEDFLDIASYEALLAGLVCGDILAGRVAAPYDIVRAKQAVETLSTLAREVGNGR